MPSTTIYKRGDVVLVPFPFTDLTGTQQRPALVVSNDAFNSTRDDVLVAAITSQVPISLKLDEFLIPKAVLAACGLPKSSIVRLLKLVSLHQHLVVRCIGQMPEPVLGQILEQLQKLFMHNPLDQILRDTLAQFHSETGTIHRLDEPAQLLHLVAHVGLPLQLLDIVKTIPVGKGIAGETAAKNRPVTICNLQTDTSGVARPGAKQTGVGGAICVPVRLGGNGGKIVGTFGIGTVREHDYLAAEINALQEIANSIAARLG